MVSLYPTRLICISRYDVVSPRLVFKSDSCIVFYALLHVFLDGNLQGWKKYFTFWDTKYVEKTSVRHYQKIINGIWNVKLSLISPLPFPSFPSLLLPFVICLPLLLSFFFSFSFLLLFFWRPKHSLGLWMALSAILIVL